MFREFQSFFMSPQFFLSNFKECFIPFGILEVEAQLLTKLSKNSNLHHIPSVFLTIKRTCYHQTCEEGYSYFILQENPISDHPLSLLAWQPRVVMLCSNGERGDHAGPLDEISCNESKANELRKYFQKFFFGVLN